jgi:hypothetical protein
MLCPEPSRTAITAGAFRVASGLLGVHAIAITPAGSTELVRSSLSMEGGDIVPGDAEGVAADGGWMGLAGLGGLS